MSKLDNPFELQFVEPNLVKMQKLYDDVQIPEYKTIGSAGMDLHYYNAEDPNVEIVIHPHETFFAATGLKMEYTANLVGLLFPRSGLASKSHIKLANSVSVIDSDYRGELKIPLINEGESDYVLRHGDRVCQMLFMPVTQVRVSVCDKLSETARGDGGFGSTGC